MRVGGLLKSSTINQNRPSTMRGKGTGGFFGSSLKTQDKKGEICHKIMNFEEEEIMNEISLIRGHEEE